MTTNATILIADISGFTDFVSSTALEHSSHIVNELLELLVEANNLDFTVSEVEGDAILFYKKGPAVPCDDLVDQCLSMFKNFHALLKLMERDVICQCGACQTVSGLGLKFIAHRGAIREINVANFTKASGLDMIIAHRLLKNEVPAREYLLATEKYLDDFGGQMPCNLTWTPSRLAYKDVGEVGVQYALLDDVRSTVPDPPERRSPVIPRGDSSFQTEIEAPMLKVYMKLIDVEGKPGWVVGLDGIERPNVTPRVDEPHTCLFQGMRVDFVLIHGEVSPDRALYLEEAKFVGTPFGHRQLVTMEKTGDQSTSLTFEVKWQDDPPPPDDMKQMYMGGCAASMEVFKSQLEEV